ncbi:hypothetical protein [Methylotetracoccus oryzae]|uniref:hypothetical protein n=1 Tax=Methylotetracoccus oryzae TaxID=1919059 RepID=UPI001117F5A2|nr:hypothetical protein [Methylotetracoccus oryzae]
MPRYLGTGTVAGLPMSAAISSASHAEPEAGDRAHDTLALASAEARVNELICEQEDALFSEPAAEISEAATHSGRPLSDTDSRGAREEEEITWAHPRAAIKRGDGNEDDDEEHTEDRLEPIDSEAAAGAGDAAEEGNIDNEAEGSDVADGATGDEAGSGPAAMPGAAGEGGMSTAADDPLAVLATGDISLIDTELAEHQRWGASAERVGTAGSADRAAFILDRAGSGALGGFGHGAMMGAAIGAGTQAVEIAAARLVGRLAGPALARSFPLPGIGAVVGGVFSVIDLATRDWGRTGETIGRFGEGGSIYEQLANSIAAISEIIGIATAVLNVIAGVIGAISIAMWVITVLTVGVASPLAATLSTIAGAIGIATMVLDGINALVLQRLVTLFRALHTFTSQADPTDVEAQGARIGEAAGASAGFIGGMAGGLTGAGLTGAGARRLGLHEPPPRVADVEPPRPATGDGPSITADPPPAPEGIPTRADRPAVPPPEPTGTPRRITDATAEAPPPVEGRASTSSTPTLPLIDPNAPTLPPVDPHAPTPLPDGPGGIPEIPRPPRVPEIGPLPDHGLELPDYQPGPSPYAPTELPPPPSQPVVDPHAPTLPGVDPHAPTLPAVAPHTPTIPAAKPHAPTVPAAEAPGASPRRIVDTGVTTGGAVPPDYHPQGWVPPEVDVPPPGHRLVDPGPPLRPGETRNPAEAFVPDQPAVGENWLYNDPVPDRGTVGTNVQRDHVIAQAKLRDVTQGPPGAQAPAGALRPIDQATVATVLAETGAATPTRPALPHTEVTFHGPNADVPQINNLRSGGGSGHISTDIVGPSREARIAAGYPEAAVDRGWVDQLGRAGEQYRLGEVNEALAGLERAEGRPVTPDTPLDMAALDRELDAAFPTPSASTSGAPGKPAVWTVKDPVTGEPRPASGAEVMDAIARDRRGGPTVGEQAVLVPPDTVTPRGNSAPELVQPSATDVGPRPVEERPRAPAAQPTRSTRPLTRAEFEAHARVLSEQFGVPLDRIRPGEYTAFHPGATPADGYITIGPDVNPLPASERPAGLANPANAALEPQAVLAHEALGHRDAELAGQVRPPDHRPGVTDPNWHEEFQASIRAALLDPALTPDQRWQLLLDAQARRRRAPDGDTVFVWTGSLRGAETQIAPAAPRPASHFRPQDQLPSIIINLDTPGSPAASPGRSAAQGTAPVVAEVGGTGAPRPVIDPNATLPEPRLSQRRPSPGGLIVAESLRPGFDDLSGLEIDTVIDTLSPDASGRIAATSDTFFELPAGPDTSPGGPPSHGLQDVRIRTGADQTKIQYHENMEFSGVHHVRVADAANIGPGERGGGRGSSGSPRTVGSVLPDDPARVLTTAVPQYGPASSKAGQPLPLEVRLHSANPSPTLAAKDPHAYSRFNATVQINTSKTTRYLLPDGRWVSMTSPDIGPAHFPAGGRYRGPAGIGEVPGIPGGVPTPRPITDTGPGVPSVRPSTATATPSLSNPVTVHPPGIAAVSAATAGTRRPETPPHDLATTSIKTGADTGAITAASSVAARAAPRASATSRSAVFAGGVRYAASTYLDTAAPASRALHSAYFGSGTRESRIARGSTAGTVLGAVAGGPVGAYIGHEVGAGVARRAEDFNAGMERGAQPIVEPVNPAYPPPPGNGTRQDIADMQNRLLAILRARAQAESLEGMMCRDAEHHEANSASLSALNMRTGETITATEAHEQAVAQRTTANQRQQTEEGNVTSALGDYANRSAGLAVIKTPLEAFTAFTYLAHALPDSPDVLRGAKRGILKMNTDGQNFLDALNGVDNAVGEQESAQPEREDVIEENAGRLSETSSAAAASQGQLADAQRSGEAIAARNGARVSDSRQREAQAAQTGAQLDGQADQTRTEIVDLSAQWQTWAQAHRQARADAMAQTRAAMIAQGWQPREETNGTP